MTTRCAEHDRAVRWCALCQPGQSAAAHAELLRPLLPGSRQHLSAVSGLTPGQIDKWARWVRENHAYAPYTLLSQRGGRGAEYVLSEDPAARGEQSVQRTGVVVTEMRTLLMDTIAPYLRGVGTPEHVITMLLSRITGDIERAVADAAQLFEHYVDDQVAHSGVPDDASALIPPG